MATDDIKKDEIIECCPVIWLSKKEAAFIKDSDILQYYYLFQYSIDRYCVMLGYGSIYNHSKNANADIEYDSENPKPFLLFKAIEDIPAGEEIVYDYEFDGREYFLKLD